MALAAAPFAAQAETWNIYGWQNHSWEFVDDNGRDTDRMNSNAGNIGFAASVDTGMDGIHVNVQCEQFTFFNHFAEHWRADGAGEFAGSSTWCNRNSKIGLSHPQAGEIMFATWLLPYNEGVAQWVDPFYDAGADSHTNIMGSVGATSSMFYNPVFGRNVGFNRRQENIIQYWSPNWNGFVFRFAWTVGNNDESKARNDHEIDPVIRSSSLAYTNGPLWLAVTWQDHEDWSAHYMKETMESSDAESVRVAGRYIMDMGDGVSVQLSAMWENLEYELNGVSDVDAAVKKFGFSKFAETYTLSGTRERIAPVMATYNMFADLDMDEQDDLIKEEKTLAELYRAFDYDTSPDVGLQARTITVTADQATAFNTANNLTGDDVLAASDYTLPTIVTAVMDNPRTVPDEKVAGNGGVNIADYDPAYDTAIAVDADGYDATKAEAAQMRNYLRAAQAAGDPAADAAAGYKFKTAYDMLVTDATLDAKTAYNAMSNEDRGVKTPGKAEVSAITRSMASANQNVKIERDAWMVSGKIKFGGVYVK